MRRRRRKGKVQAGWKRSRDEESRSKGMEIKGE